MSKHFIETGGETYVDQFGNQQYRDYKKVIEIGLGDDPFYLTFIRYVGWMYDIRGNVALNVMAKLMEFAEFNTGIVNLSPAMRRKIKDEVGIGAPALTRALALLTEKGAIKQASYTDKKTGEIKKSRGEYMINPQMFWKGELSKRKGLIVEFRAIYEDSAPKGWEGFNTDSTEQK